MKKIVSLIVLITLIFLPFTVLASDNPVTETPEEDIPTIEAPEENPDEEETASVGISFWTTVMNPEKMTIQVQLGNFVGVEAPAVMSASFTLNYNAENITNIDGQGLEGWRLTIQEETNRVMLEADAANPNTTIAEITFYFNKNITEAVTDTINISELNISDGDLYDQFYSDTNLKYTIEPAIEESVDDKNNNDEETPNQNNPGNNKQEQDNNKEQATTNESNNKPITDPDPTLAPDKTLPQTGISIAIIVAITIVVILGVIGIIRYKQIEIK